MKMYLTEIDNDLETIALSQTNNEVDHRGPDKEQGSNHDIDTAAGSEDIFTRAQIMKNLVAVSVGFVFLFTAFGSMSSLQSSLNMASGTGSGSLAVIYAGLIVSCLFLPPVMIAQFGCKWTMPVCVTGYVLYLLANFYPVWATMVPTAVLVGLGAAPLWSAKCTYLTTMAVWYARLTRNDIDAMINKFFGVFFMFFQTCRIWGNIIVSTVLSSPTNKTDNATGSSSADVICGARFCKEEIQNSNNTNLERPVETKIYVLCGIYVGVALVGLLVIISLLDKLKLSNETGSKSRCVSPRLLVATFTHIVTSRYQLLLIPLTIYTGLEQAFMDSDFTRSYITCTLGIQSVGYVMICYGVSDALFSFLFGHLVKYLGHVVFFVLGFILHGACQITLLLWVPDAQQLYVFYVIAALWGMGDAVMQTQMNALYGLLFVKNKEAGFANYKLWESTGFILQYAYNDFICTSTKLYICLTFYAVGICGYCGVEVLYSIEKNKETKK